jgi:hypothetical protein
LESPSLEAVRGYNADSNATGAQTERPGAALAGEVLAWRLDLTGRLCPILSFPVKRTTKVARFFVQFTRIQPSTD